jgi:hypothetical protein
MYVRLEDTLELCEKSACRQRLILLRSVANVTGNNKNGCEVGCYINEWFYAFRKAVRGRDYDKKPFLSHANEECYYTFRSSLSLNTLISVMEDFDKGVSHNTNR